MEGRESVCLIRQWDIDISSALPADGGMIRATGKNYPNIWRRNSDNTELVQGLFKDT